MNKTICYACGLEISGKSVKICADCTELYLCESCFGEIKKTIDNLKKGKTRNKPTVKELILAGKDADTVIAETGCTRGTFNTIKSSLRKIGLLKEEELPVKCSERIKECFYGAKYGSEMICDYLGKVGHSRKCDPEKCIAFKKKKKRGKNN